MAYKWDKEFQLDVSVPNIQQQRTPLKQRFIQAIEGQLALLADGAEKEVYDNARKDPRWFTKINNDRWHLFIYLGNFKATPKPILLRSKGEVKTALEKIKKDALAGKMDADFEEKESFFKQAADKRRAAWAAKEPVEQPMEQEQPRKVRRGARAA